MVVRVSSDCSGKPSGRCRALNRRHLPIGRVPLPDSDSLPIAAPSSTGVWALSRAWRSNTHHIAWDLSITKKGLPCWSCSRAIHWTKRSASAGVGRNVTSHRADASSATTGLAWPRRPMVCAAAPGTPAAQHNATQVPPHGGIARGPPRHVGRGEVALGTPSPTPGLCHPSVAVGTCDQLAVGITQGRGGKAGCWHLRSSWRLGANAPHTREGQVVRAWWSTSFAWSARMRTR